MERITCATCGFLSVHDEKGELVSLPENARATSSVPAFTGFLEKLGALKCFVGAISYLKKTAGDRQKEVEQATTSRTCDHFVEWRADLSPKEHRDMLNAQELREMEKQRIADDKKWQEEMRERDRKAENRHKVIDRFWGVFLLLAGSIIGWFLKPNSQQPTPTPTPIIINTPDKK